MKLTEMKRTTGRTHLTELAPNGGPQPIPRPTHETVARRAYEIWQRHGCPQGTAFQDWLAAQAELAYSGKHHRH